MKFRRNVSLALYNNRRPRRSRWKIPLLIIATGWLYAGLSFAPATTAPGNLARQNVPLPLELPRRNTGGLDAGWTHSMPSIAKLAISHTSIIEPPLSADIPMTSAAEGSATSLTATLTESATAENTALWLEHKIQPGDTLTHLFNDWKLSSKVLYRIINSGKAAKQLSHIKPGQILRIHVDVEDRFSKLEYQIDPAKILQVTRARDNDELTATLVERKINILSNEVSGVIESSLFESAQKAGLSDVLTMELAKIFGWDIDFALEIRSGDRFSVVYSEEWLDGKKLADGPILAAEFVNQGKVYRAVRFEEPGGKADYYTPDGKRMHKAFLRTPVKFSRISSGFTQRRWHPVLKKWRSHKGVDYAAPIGTPVKAAGEGKVAFVGRKGGYGKVVILQHQDKYSTVYGHLSGYAKGLKRGKRVRQGQLIGYVGQTGLASGPHLHYEFRVDGQHRNPLKVTFLPAATIDQKFQTAFNEVSRPLLAQLDSLNRTLIAEAPY
jgi:murein DD-endopeptidase MepM/ murein hydrolase activator NlpD